MALKVVLLSVLVAVALARPDTLPAPTYHAPPPPHVPPPSDDVTKYEYQYAVKDEESGNDYGKFESREGKSGHGNYYVWLPDTRLMKVEYYVTGDSGYVADVTYEGEAVYPVPPAPKPKPPHSYVPTPTYA